MEGEMEAAMKMEAAIHAVSDAIDNTREFILDHRRPILSGLGALLLLGVAMAAFEFYATYNHYEAIVTTRLSKQSLQRPAGIYAAPRRVSIGQSITRDELKKRLLRAGYLESDQVAAFAAGSFVVPDNAVEIRTNDFARTDVLPASVRVTFSSKTNDHELIAGIKDNVAGHSLKTIQLPPELITADINTKTQTRSYADFDDFPAILVKAVTAIEDRQFFNHSGVDLGAICRAFVKNSWSGEIRQGGSTITQQLIKTHFLTPKRTYERKFAEAMMAIAIEHHLSKQQIFVLYGNRVYLGQSGITTVYGFKQASRVFFGKETSEVSLAEAALLAGIVQAPNRYSPYLHPEAAIARRNAVLDAMVETNNISADEAATAKSEQLALQPPARLDESAAPHFIDYIKRELAAHRVDESDEPHLRIETTLDPDLQQAANQAVKAHLAKLDKFFASRVRDARPDAALIAIDPHTGEILAMVGGRDYTTSQFNRVIDAHRQPGSVFKPIVYAAALAQGMSPTTTFDDKAQDFELSSKAVYHPENFGHSYSNRPVMLREGIVRSLNVVAVNAALQVGLSNVANMAERAGLPRPYPYPSMALGAFEATPLQIAQAYSAFANNGLGVVPFAVKAIRSEDAVITENVAEKRGVLTSSTAYIITDTLAEAVNRGTASRIRQLGYRGPAAGKTGSSHDAWFAGYTPNLLVVVWVGFDDYRNLELTGGEAAIPIWTDFINHALALRPDLYAAKFKQPDGMESVEIDPDTGTVANEFCPHHVRVLLPNYMMPGECFTHHAPVPTDESLPSDPEVQLLREEDERAVEPTPTPTPTPPAGRIGNPQK